MILIDLRTPSGAFVAEYIGHLNRAGLSVAAGNLWLNLVVAAARHNPPAQIFGSVARKPDVLMKATGLPPVEFALCIQELCRTGMARWVDGWLEIPEMKRRAALRRIPTPDSAYLC